jgi:hypothetical protein
MVSGVIVVCSDCLFVSALATPTPPHLCTSTILLVNLVYDLLPSARKTAIEYSQNGQFSL